MKKVYFSTAISGHKVASPTLLMNMVKTINELGFDVLSEHVVVVDMKEKFKVMSRKAGQNIPHKEGYEDVVRNVDLQWVDDADYMVVIADGPSLGVGIEIEHALLRKSRGLPECNILCLVHEANLSGLSAMVSGIRSEVFSLRTYKEETDALVTVTNFLLNNKLA